MLEVVNEELRQVAAGLDPDLLSTHDAARVLDEVAAAEKLLAGIKTLVASRAAASGLWRRDGARDEAEWLARKTGTSAARARETLVASEQVRALPELESAVRAGRLSGEQAAVVADAAASDPACASEMLRRARRDSLANLRHERDRVKAASCADPDARHRRIHAGRYLRFGTDADGAGTGSWRVTPEIQAEIRARLAPFMERSFETARAEGRRESPDAYAADGLLEMARAASGDPGVTEAAGETKRPPRQSVPAKIIVRIDHSALVRGHTVAGETCDLGGAPVPVAVVDEMLASGDAFLAAILTRGSDVARVVHLGRGPSAHQLTALEWRDLTCCRVGCTYHPAEWDHRRPYSEVKVTTLDNLEGFCKADHDRKSYQGYAVVPSDEVAGKVELRPPEAPALLDTS